MRLIELSHVIEDGTETYPGLPAPRICDYWTREASAAHYAAGTSFQIGRIDMVANTGTYVDVPFHRYAEGADLAVQPLASLVELPGLCLRVPAGLRRIGARAFESLDLSGRAVLIATGWSRHWGTPAYCRGHPHLDAGAAEYLRDAGAALVGIDSLNIDATDGATRPVHTLLLGAGIPIVEHLCNLEALPERDFVFHAPPPRIRGLGSFPVRAWARCG